MRGPITLFLHQRSNSKLPGEERGQMKEYEVMDHSIYLHKYACIWESEMMTSDLIYAAPIYMAS
jgi:hypothetical protein